MAQWIGFRGADAVAFLATRSMAETLVRGAIVFFVVSLFVRRAKGLSPAHRHVFWLLAVTSCILITPLSFVALPLRVARVPLPGPVDEALRTAAAGGRTLGVAGGAPGGTALGTASGAWDSTAASLTAGPLPGGLSWTLCAGAVWAAGAFILASLIVAGALRLGALVRRASAPSGKAFARLLEETSWAVGCGRKTRVLLSCRCRVPFTCGVFKPVILFPAAAGRWPRERFRAVLTHELAHVRRLDYLTQLVSRAVCSTLWFCPYLWVAHARLHVEQEKAADALTVRTGTKPVEYAGHLLDLARLLRRRGPLLTGLLIPGSRRNILEKRLLDILRMKNEPLHERPGQAPGLPSWRPLYRLPWHFLRPFSLCLLCALPLLFLNPVSGGAGRAPLGEDAQAAGNPGSEADLFDGSTPFDTAAAAGRMAGTWVNMEYGSWARRFSDPQKIVYRVDGGMEAWMKTDNPGPSARATFQIVKSWIGKDGSLYCRTRIFATHQSQSSTTELWRLDPEGTVWESNYYWGIQETFPGKIDPTPDTKRLDTYAVYYRQ